MDSFQDELESRKTNAAEEGLRGEKEKALKQTLLDKVRTGRYIYGYWMTNTQFIRDNKDLSTVPDGLLRSREGR